MAKKPEGNGFAELLRYSHMVAPEVMALKDGGLLAGFGSPVPTSRVRQHANLNT